MGTPRRPEAFGPLGGAGDEHRDAVDERAPRRQGLASVELGGLLGSDRQVGDQHIDPGLSQFLGHIHRGDRRLLDQVGHIGADPVQSRAPLHRYVEGWDTGKGDSVVLPGRNRLGEVLSHLGGVDIESGYEPDVTHVVSAQDGVHQPGDHLVGRGVSVKAHPLHQRGSTVSHAHDGDSYLFSHIGHSLANRILSVK